MCKPKTVAIIQARLGSTRLPGKVLQDICGKTMIERVLERVQRSKMIDDIVVATTGEPADKTLVEFCHSKGWKIFAGSEHDVLDRYTKAATLYDADRIVRITSDCPLIDPILIDDVVGSLSDKHDYACNFYPRRRYPRGLDCEALTRETLNKINELADQPNYREHVTLFVYRNEENFSMGSVTCEKDHSNLRWTVDTPDDLRLVRTIYDHFGTSNFDWQQVIAAHAEHPEWSEINRHSHQKVA